MMRRIYFSIILFFVMNSTALAAGISGPDVRVFGHEINVDTGVVLDEKQIKDIQNGISKEIIIYVDLFRVWSFWPDEFVTGKTIGRTLKCDPVKKEYMTVTQTENHVSEKRFNDCKSLIDWSLRIENLTLTKTDNLDPADYFVMVYAEGRVRKLPPFINMLFFFVKEKEFNISKESLYFPVNMHKGLYE